MKKIDKIFAKLDYLGLGDIQQTKCAFQNSKNVWQWDLCALETKEILFLDEWIYQNRA